MRNRGKDLETEKALESMGWRTLVVWECALKGRERKPLQGMIDAISQWLDSGTSNEEIKGGPIVGN